MIDKKNKLVVTIYINYNNYYDIQLHKKLKIIEILTIEMYITYIMHNENRIY